VIDAAERTLDLQYYLWDSDAVGYLILSRVLAAADRGVRVRLLVDDLNFRRRTRSIANLALHENLEIRVYNPWMHRSSSATQVFEFVRRFAKLDERMHNKLLIADGENAIVGGRNLATEHFGLAEKFNLVDFDILLAGTQVTALSNSFIAFWQSPSSRSGSAFRGATPESDLEARRAQIAERLDGWGPALSAVVAEEERWGDRLGRLKIPVGVDEVHVVADTPGTSVGSAPTEVIDALHSAVDDAQSDIVVATPFFVPSEVDVEWYQRLTKRGVRVRVLTNSLASNQGTISNSGLNKQRLSVVRAGVELHELRPDAAAKTHWEIPPESGRYLGLHAKVYVIDREAVFMGSVNLDPRSKYINTEVGVFVESSELSRGIADAVALLMTTDNAWEVEVGPDGRLRWRSDTGIRHRQPARSPAQRAADAIFSRLPISDYI
jgi:putative cardiolipin synthase